jgi:hypothetical protein
MPDPKTSAGARLERQAFRDYLKRKLKYALLPEEKEVLPAVLKWVNVRFVDSDHSRSWQLAPLTDPTAPPAPPRPPDPGLY